MDERTPILWSSNVASSSSYTQDAPSTSSSTLVNGDQRSDRKIQARIRRSISSSSSASTVRAMKRRPTSIYDANEDVREEKSSQRAFNIHGWSKDSKNHIMRYPDDHRCSDYELDGGLCGCVKAPSVETTSDSNPEMNDQVESIGEEDEDTAYNRRLFAARNRKILLDNSNSYMSADQPSSSARLKSLKDRNHIRHQRTRSHSSSRKNIRSDPTSIEESSEDDRHAVQQKSILENRRRPKGVLDKPSSHASHMSVSDAVDGTMDETEFGQLSQENLPMNTSPRKNKTLRRPNLDLSVSFGSANEHTVQSAARKSISNVYERLLREEEERRESERIRKEKARQRRKEERLRKQEDSEMLARLISSSSSKAEEEFHQNMINGNERSITDMPPYTSPILAVSPPSTRETSLEIKPSEQEFEETHYGDERGNGHLHPAHAFDRSSNAAKLAALREANVIGDTKEDHSPSTSDIPSSLGLAPAFSQKEKDFEGLEVAEAGTSGIEIQTRNLCKPTEHPSSPRIASSASSDSVRSWTFPNRTSPSASPQLLSPIVQSSPRLDQGQNHQFSSPRRNGHRRGTHKGGSSPVLSLSARVPNLDSAQVAAKVESTLHSPILRSSLSADSLRVSKTEPESFTSKPSSTATSKRRVSFSPQPDFIEAFEDPTEEEEYSQNDTEQWQSNGMAIPSIHIPDEAIEEKDKINLDAILEQDVTMNVSDSNNSLASGHLRGSPLKRTMASPHFPGMYSSPAANSLSNESPTRTKAIKWKPKRSISPPINVDPSGLHFIEGQGPPPSRSWNSNLSRSDSSISNNLIITEVPEEEEEITEGSELSRTVGLPLQSTPPRRRRVKEQKQEISPSGIPIGADDSLRMTLDQLNRVLRYAEEYKESKEEEIEKSQKHLETTAKNLGTLVDSIKGKNEDNEQKNVILDQEYVRQLEETRKKLAAIVRSYDQSYSFSNVGSKTISSFMLWTFFFSFCIVQFGILVLVNAAAHAKAEQIYLTMHYGLIGGVEDILVSESRSKSSLFAPLFIRWGLVPEIHGMAIGDRERLVKGWWNMIRWVHNSLWNYGNIYHPIRITSAKIAYSLGWYGISNVPLGTIIPS